MLTKIEVNDEDIKNGQNGNGMSCPVYFAIKRLLLPEYNCHISDKDILIYHIKEAIVAVNPKYILAQKSEFIEMLTLPNKARSKVRNFDRLKNIQAFDFELEISEKFLKTP